MATSGKIEYKAIHDSRNRKNTMANNQQMRIGDFELINHGIEHSQYFQGCGVAFTQFENVVTGIGNNPAEAIDDCLEQIAQAGFETEGMETRIMEQEGWEALPITPETCTHCLSRKSFGECESCELRYHVSIRWNAVE